MKNENLENMASLGKVVLAPGLAITEALRLSKHREYSVKDTLSFITGTLGWEAVKLSFYGGMTYRIAEKLGQTSANYF